MDDKFVKGKTWISIRDGFLCISDSDGNVILPPNQYVLPKRPGGVMPLYPPSFGDGVTPAATPDGASGYIDTEGKVALPFIYEAAYPFFNGRAVVKSGGKWGMIDRHGVVKVPFSYDAILYDGTQDAADGLICVACDGKFGYVTLDGELVIPPRFDFFIDKCSGEFREGVAPVAQDGEVFFIDRSGKRVITLCERFDYVASFWDGYAQVIRHTKDHDMLYGYIDREGKLAVPTEYRQIGCRFSEGVFAFSFHGRIVYINHIGRIVLETPYDAVTEFNGGIAWGRKDGYWESFNRTGEVMAGGVSADNILFGEGETWIAEENETYRCIDIHGRPLSDAQKVPPCPYYGIYEEEWILQCLRKGATAVHEHA